MPLGPLYVLLGEVSVQVLSHFLIGLFVFLVLSHMSSLYILKIKPLSDESLANMYFPYSWFPFHFANFSLAMQRLFILMKSYLFILAFMSLALRDILVKILLRGLRFSCLSSPEGLLWYHDLYLSLLSILSLFLCMV